MSHIRLSYLELTEICLNHSGNATVVYGDASESSHTGPRVSSKHNDFDPDF